MTPTRPSQYNGSKADDIYIKETIADILYLRPIVMISEMVEIIGHFTISGMIASFKISWAAVALWRPHPGLWRTKQLPPFAASGYARGKIS